MISGFGGPLLVALVLISFVATLHEAATTTTTTTTQVDREQQQQQQKQAAASVGSLEQDTPAASGSAGTPSGGGGSRLAAVSVSGPLSSASASAASAAPAASSATNTDNDEREEAAASSPLATAPSQEPAASVSVSVSVSVADSRGREAAAVAKEAAAAAGSEAHDDLKKGKKLGAAVGITAASEAAGAANAKNRNNNNNNSEEVLRLAFDEQVNAASKQSSSSPVSQPPSDGLQGGGGGGGADEKVLHERRKALPPEISSSSSGNSRQRPVVYTNQFVIEVAGGEREARELAQKHGFVYLNHILDDFYHLEHRRLSKRSLSADQDLEDISIRDEPQVLMLERQVLKRRVKRDFLDVEPPPELTRLGRAHSSAQIRPPNQPRPQPVQHQHQQQLRPNMILSGGGGRNYAHQHPPTRPANQSPPPPARLSQTPASLDPRQRIQHLQPDSDGFSPAGGAHSDNLLDSIEVSASTPAIATHLRPANRPAAIYQNLSAGAATTQIPSFITSVIASSMGQNNSNARTRQDSSSNSSQAADSKRPFNDPSWPLMWYLDGGAKNGFDLNVMAAWKMGYTGKGIVITILDDGLEKDHPDLQANYDPLASFDINGDDADPMPRYDINDSNRHGTRCAGEVAAVPDNNICSIGIAYNSRVGGVRMLDGDVTDAVEARSLALNNQHIHIYSASWGPDDNGKTVDGPGVLATRAFIDGVTNGRQKLGSIFVFASGNGGREHDNCNCDGYTNSIWTLSISSATENGYVPWYIEACSSTLATTYSSGSYEERQIATTDLHHSCTSSHTGTSASAPLAAGICALVLESNPRLTWRDMQHIVVRTAKPANLVAKDWRANALGRNVSHAFGYGLMDAAAMILMAKQWTTVPTQYTCAISLPQMERPIFGRNRTEVKLSAQCANVSYLEHVQSKVTLSAPRRGDLHIYLVSPGGTRSTLLAKRPNDHAEQGFSNWPFMTVHNWGESPNGIWTLEVRNDGSPQTRAYLKEWTLILYGTKEDPNKHLDSLAAPPPEAQQHPKANQQHAKPAPQASRAQATGPPPPPPISLEPQQRAPAATSPPPPPTTTTTTISSQPGGGHWSTYSPPSSSLPPPPPLAPGSRVSPTTSTQPSVTSSSAATTSTATSTSTSSTQASYVTTFDSIVSSGRPSQQQHNQNNKADFDIVMPPAERPVHVGTNEIVVVPATGEPTADSKRQPPTAAEEPTNIRKLPVDLMDGSAPNSAPAGRPATQGQHSAGLDLAGNQLDPKLMSKDYRSSGDQQLANDQTATQSAAGASGRQEKQHKSSSSATFVGDHVANQWSILAWCLLASLLINRRQQLDQLVRPSNVI